MRPGRHRENLIAKTSTGMNRGWLRLSSDSLDTYIVWELVKRGAAIWKLALYSTSQLLDTLDDFDDMINSSEYAGLASGHGKAPRRVCKC